MESPLDPGASDGVIATIQNRDNPDQLIAIRYLQHENGFATEGIRAYFGMKEILIPVHLVAKDLELMGTIVSAILEEISRAYEKGTMSQYASLIEVMGKAYSLTDHGSYKKLEPL